MRRIVWMVAALAMSLAGVPGVSARAEGAVNFVATVHIDCFGCGDSTGTASICVTGEANGSAFAGCGYPIPRSPRGTTLLRTGNETAVYVVHEGTGTDCVIQGTADGSTSGVLDETFHWSRLGAIAIINTTGDINGSGYGVFVATGAVGNPCGTTNMQAIVQGVVIGE